MPAGADTICARASGAGRAGVAIIRISGPQAGAALRALSGDLPPPRTARLRVLRRADGAPIDRALLLWFPGPASYTGEDAAELHVHGGPAVIEATLEALLQIPGVRPAEPGEFTRRAFENGKLDLTQAEAVADLIDAETEGQLRQALRQMEGALSTQVEGWRARLISALAFLEAAIDFPDEDLPQDLAARAAPILEPLRAEITASLADAARGDRVREGYRIAILGAPNAGKSSLLNALAGREAAIVSDIPGTTRDVVEVRLTLAGYPVWIADTAGLREASDQIEAEGVRRALARALEADLRLAVVDASETAPSPDVARVLQPRDLIVRSKIDLSGNRPPADHIAISTRTGEGLAGLIATIESRVALDLAPGEAPALTRARHRLALQQALNALDRADASIDLGAEFAAEDLRMAAQALAGLVGRVDVEDVLGEVFSTFCIGK